MVQKKIFNDPVYGFITISDPLLLALIGHPWMQRLTRIRQLGLTYLVYPGALHTRFHHALGSLHLMSEAIYVLRSKGIDITDEEARAVSIAILLHDIGHGPFSHALENVLIEDTSHEWLTGMFMRKLNEEFRGSLELALRIYNGTYAKKFLQQLVSGQLDMDRLDYLNRDSFYSGVAEGVVSNDRIIKMLHVHKDKLVVEAKGIYSIEKFLIARRLMYWQVYLHKTVLSSEQLLIKIIQRARKLCISGNTLFATPSLSFLLRGKFHKSDLQKNSYCFEQFASLDDSDIIASIKVWSVSNDPILRELCLMLINRKLYKIRIKNDRFDSKVLKKFHGKAGIKFRLEKKEDAGYFAFTGSVTNSAYSSEEKINIFYKDQTVRDIAAASDLPNILVMSKPVRKYFLCIHEGLL